MSACTFSVQRSVRSSTSIPVCDHCRETPTNHFWIASLSSCRHSALRCVCHPSATDEADSDSTSMSMQKVIFSTTSAAPAGGEASQTDLKPGVLRTWSLRRTWLAGQSPQNFNTLLEWHFLPSVPTVSAWQKATSSKGYSCSFDIVGTASRINFQLLLALTGYIFDTKASAKYQNQRMFGTSSVLCRIQQ